MRQSYRCYGLHLLADGHIPGLPADAPAASPDVRVWLHGPASASAPSRQVYYRSSSAGSGDAPALCVGRADLDGAFHFVYRDGTEFVIDGLGREVRCRCPAAASAADIAVYLCGPILGFVLRLRGVLGLHASAVAAGDGAIALLGETGAGKSTAALGFLRLGCPVLADDISALDEVSDGFQVRSAYPRLNLWPDVAGALHENGTSLPRVAPIGGLDDRWDKRYLELEPGREFASDSRPLTALYVLGPRAPANAAPLIEELSPAQAFMALANQTYANYAIDASIRAGEFQALGRLVRAVPVRLLHPPGDPGRVMDMCREILRDVERVRARATLRIAAAR